MIFKTHKENIPQIEAILATFGVCFFHGDGNMYTEQKDSDFRKEFSNPKTEESGYRIKFVGGQNVPQTVEELNNALLAARNAEVMQGMKTVQNGAQKTITVKKKEDSSEGSKLEVKTSAGTVEPKVPVNYKAFKKEELINQANAREIHIPAGSLVPDIIALLEAKDLEDADKVGAGEQK